jgi:hypothetical protein
LGGVEGPILKYQFPLPVASHNHEAFGDSREAEEGEVSTRGRIVESIVSHSVSTTASRAIYTTIWLSAIGRRIEGNSHSKKWYKEWGQVTPFSLM